MAQASPSDGSTRLPSEPTTGSDNNEEASFDDDKDDDDRPLTPEEKELAEQLRNEILKKYELLQANDTPEMAQQRKVNAEEALAWEAKKQRRVTIKFVKEALTKFIAGGIDLMTQGLDESQVKEILMYDEATPATQKEIDMAIEQAVQVKQNIAVTEAEQGGDVDKMAK